MVPLWTLKRLGITPRPEQKRAFLALWRHVGYYLGVPLHILRQYFVDTDVADQFLSSSLLNVFSDLEIPHDHHGGQNPTVSVLAAAVNRVPSVVPLSFHLGIARHLLGDAIADRRGLPPTSFPMKLAVRAGFGVLNAPVQFGYWYLPIRRGWLDKYRAVIRDGLISTVRWGLGKRRVTFYPHVPLHGSGAVDHAAQARKEAVEVANVTPDPVAWEPLLWKISELTLELLVVMCTAATVVAVLIHRVL